MTIALHIVRRGQAPTAARFEMGKIRMHVRSLLAAAATAVPQRCATQWLCAAWTRILDCLSVFFTIVTPEPAKPLGAAMVAVNIRSGIFIPAVGAASPAFTDLQVGPGASITDPSSGSSMPDDTRQYMPADGRPSRSVGSSTFGGGGDTSTVTTSANTDVADADMAIAPRMPQVPESTTFALFGFGPGGRAPAPADLNGSFTKNREAFGVLRAQADLSAVGHVGSESLQCS